MTPSFTDTPEFLRKAGETQARLAAALRPAYDFVVCGAGSAGSVVAARLAEDRDAHVLLLEAGDDDEAESVSDPALWPTNLGTARDWGFEAEPNPHLGGRALSMAMGRGLGGGSSINVGVWARGHRTDWDGIAADVGDAGWGWRNVLDLYRRMEDWQGAPDPDYRGRGGPVWVQPAADPSPVALALLDAAGEIGVPTFAHPNGRMMEGPGGAAISDTLVRRGRRHSLYRAFVRPMLARGNLTVLTGAHVRRVLFDGRRAAGVEFERGGAVATVSARAEVVLSLGAMHTPKVLMHSGVGDADELARFAIPVVQHLPGVGRNLQDHVSFGCTWAYREPIAPRGSGSGATLYGRTRPELAAPDLLFCQVEFPVPSERTAHMTPAHGWTMFAGLAHPESRGRLRLTAADPHAPLAIDANFLSAPADLRSARRCIELCRALGNAPAFRPLVAGEAMPGDLRGAALDGYIRDAAVTYWHQCGTAKMGRDPLAVVDATLAVHGVEGLRVADGSVLPRVPTGNTQAPCAIVGERAAAFLSRAHGLALAAMAS